MSQTPIKDFIDKYVSENGTRLHMPGHKGSFGYARDLTEVADADSLYEAEGIILESENKTSESFGSYHTFYGTEGSSQMIKAMCYLAIKCAGGDNPVFVATRNAHKSFINAAMLLGFDIEWVMPEGKYNLCSSDITPEILEKTLKKLQGQQTAKNVTAVYVTSPDYLGNILDIEGLASVAHKFGTILICDNAHGAYFNFVPQLCKHPISLGADMCCDSAHKTLPVLTGGAYLHISKTAPEMLRQNYDEIRSALLLFGSTSPSYLILESLDMASERVSTDAYMKCSDAVADAKKQLLDTGITLTGIEPLKITFSFDSNESNGTFLFDSNTENYEINGKTFGEFLRQNNFECEYIDRDFVVTMWSPFMDYEADLNRLVGTTQSFMDKYHLPGSSPKASSGSSSGASDCNMGSLPDKVYMPGDKVYKPGDTLYMPHHIEKTGPQILGKIAADTTISCPPAISPIVAGERIDENILRILQYYGITEIEILD